MERRLINYLPPFVRKFNEISEVMETEQKELELAWNNAEATLDDQYVMTATANGLKRYEKIFGIVPKATDTLDERRFMVLSKMNERPPYTLEALRNVLNALCGENGYTLLMNTDEYELIVKLGVNNDKNYDAVVHLLDRILPANIVRTISMFNTYSMLADLTHEQLAAYTHDEIRKDVLA